MSVRLLGLTRVSTCAGLDKKGGLATSLFYKAFLGAERGVCCLLAGSEEPVRWGNQEIKSITPAPIWTAKGNSGASSWYAERGRRFEEIN